MFHLIVLLLHQLWLELHVPGNSYDALNRVRSLEENSLNLICFIFSFLLITEIPPIKNFWNTRYILNYRDCNRWKFLFYSKFHIFTSIYHSPFLIVFFLSNYAPRNWRKRIFILKKMNCNIFLIFSFSSRKKRSLCLDIYFRITIYFSLVFKYQHFYINKLNIIID